MSNTSTPVSHAAVRDFSPAACEVELQPIETESTNDTSSCRDVITDDKAWCEDAAWALKALGDGRFINCEKNYAAVYHKEVQALGDDPLQLEQDLGRKFGVTPRRIITIYVGTED